jgi:hypothetical protein
MRIKTYIISIIFLLISCKETREFPVTNKEFKFIGLGQENEIYSLINDFVLDSLFKNAVVTVETMSFCHASDNDSNDVMPPGFFYCYNQILLDTLMNAMIIDSIDLKFFIRQMDQVNKLKWDSKKLRVKMVSRDTLYQMSLRRQDIFQFVTKNYHARGFLVFSTPLFSKNNKVIVMSIAYFCGSLCGGGIIYAFKKVDNKWYILYSNQEWIS